MSLTVASDTNGVTIAIDGMFDLSVQSEFRKAYEDNSQSSKYVIDMRMTEYMDSAAFGMLLVFRDYAGGDDSKIEIVNTSEEIKRSFIILQFDRLFSIS